MKRTLAGLLALALILQAGCSGSSGTLPGGTDGGDQQGPHQSGPNTLYLGPASGPSYGVDGDHSTAAVPGQYSFATTASQDELRSLLAPLGFDLLASSHNYATVQAREDMPAASAIQLLEKQFEIGGVQPVTRLNTASPRLAAPWLAASPVPPGLRGASRTPLNPWFNDRALAIAGGDAANGAAFLNWFGDAMPLQYQGFPTAWDIEGSTGIEDEPVVIAIIDAGWFDYSTDIRGELDETNQIDAANSGSVDGAGTFTSGLAAATWETWDNDSDGATPEVPFRDTGEVMFGILASNKDTFIPRAVDFDNPADDIQADEVFNEGFPGINDSTGAKYILIKTGSASGNAWTFTDAEIAESVDHAVSAGANIILLGMFANGAPSGQLSASLAAARTADALVIAPAGDVAATATFDDTTGEISGFTGTAIADIQTPATRVTPGSDPSVLSVTMTGFNRFPGLPDVDFGGGPIPDGGAGYTPILADPIAENFGTVMAIANGGGNIAAVGYGLGFAPHPLLTSGGQLLPAENFFSVINVTGGTFATPVFNFSSSYAAAYVAGAASLIFQILADVNGTPPTDDEVASELMSTVQFSGMAGVFGTNGTDGGLLNAGLAAASAINGGSLKQTLPALQFTSVVLNQSLDAITRETDVTVTPTIANGTAPFELTVDWGDGNAPVVVSNWNSSDPVTLTGGYSTLGPKQVNVSVTDANNLTVQLGASLFVINPLSCTISISDAQGFTVLPGAVVSATNYRFSANATNVFTGEINGTPNTTTFNWNFDADAAYEATGPNPTFAFPSTGSFTVTLDVAEDVRPDSSFTLNVTVVPPA